jgi:hypothetical protein
MVGNSSQSSRRITYCKRGLYTSSFHQMRVLKMEGWRECISQYWTMCACYCCSLDFRHHSGQKLLLIQAISVITLQETTYTHRWTRGMIKQQLYNICNHFVANYTTEDTTRSANCKFGTKRDICLAMFQILTLAECWLAMFQILTLAGSWTLQQGDPL